MVDRLLHWLCPWLVLFGWVSTELRLTALLSYLRNGLNQNEIGCPKSTWSMIFTFSETINRKRNAGPDPPIGRLSSCLGPAPVAAPRVLISTANFEINWGETRKYQKKSSHLKFSTWMRKIDKIHCRWKQIKLYVATVSETNSGYKNSYTINALISN